MKITISDSDLIGVHGGMRRGEGDGMVRSVTRRSALGWRGWRGLADAPRDTQGCGMSLKLFILSFPLYRSRIADLSHNEQN